MVYSPSGHLHNRLLQELLEIEREVAEGDGTWAWESAVGMAGQSFERMFNMFNTFNISLH
jgi:hypothetical protein